MEKIDVCEYIDSCDIKKYLKSINYQFNAFEAMCIINGNTDMPLMDKLKAFHNIRLTYDNCEYIESDGSKWVNINKTIGNYIDEINEYITSLFLDEHSSVFSYAYLDFENNDISAYEDEELFDKFTDVLEYMNKDDRRHDLIVISRFKTCMDLFKKNSDLIFINYDYEITHVITNKNTDSLINNHPFKEDNVKISVPFKRGDIIRDNRRWWHRNEEGKMPIYEFVEKVDNGIKVLYDGVEKIETEYLGMEYYK